MWVKYNNGEKECAPYNVKFEGRNSFIQYIMDDDVMEMSGFVWEDDETEFLLSLDKRALIEHSKLELSKFLEENPLFSTCKYQDGRHYTVSYEKQQQLNTILFNHSIGIISKLYWNTRSLSSEEWTETELKTLASEISNYVTPLVDKQRKYEVNINNCTSRAELDLIEIQY